jgi:hypothetical protein
MSSIKIARNTVVEIPPRNQNNFEVDARGDRKLVKTLQVRSRRVTAVCSSDEANSRMLNFLQPASSE